MNAFHLFFLVWFYFSLAWYRENFNCELFIIVEEKRDVDICSHVDSIA